MVIDDIIKEAKSIEDLDNRIKFLEKSIKKIKDPKEILLIKRMIEEIEKMKIHVPIEGQDLSINIKNVEIEAAPKYQRIEPRDRMRSGQLENLVGVGQNHDNNNDENLVYQRSGAKTQIKYEAFSATNQDTRKNVEKLLSQEGIDRTSANADPQVQARAREIATEYLKDTVVDIDDYLSPHNKNLNEQQFYEKKLLFDQADNIEEKKKKRERNQIQDYYVKPREDSF
ncbi:hypothetical protein J4471_01215 [Candidatus Woesearchaeota archaeon]|nr:hypothetical protein [Candidatus Woesearchaeota archaeon]